MLREDGLTACIGLVPPPSKRALLFVDPSYELRDEHRDVIDAVVKLHKRFATGVVAIWYPVIERRWVERYERALRATDIAADRDIRAVRRTRAPRRRARRQRHVRRQSALATRRRARAALPWLAERLAVDDGASFRAVE